MTCHCQHAAAYGIFTSEQVSRLIKFYMLGYQIDPNVGIEIELFLGTLYQFLEGKTFYIFNREFLKRNNTTYPFIFAYN